MKIILSLILSCTLQFASSLQEDIWWKGETLLTFFEKHKISKDIYFNLSKTDKELCSEIYAGVLFQKMINDKGDLEQVLIPISDEMQIHIFKDNKNKFTLDIIPIEFKEIRQSITIPIKNSPYQDIVETTGNKALANEFIIAFKKSINFKRLRKNDLISILFKQKIRMGRYFGTPEILGASVQMRNKIYYIFQNPADKRYYNDKAKSLTSFLLRIPLKYTRISSKFTLKRFHPILKKYRAHLGVDFAAPTGRRVNATADGKIIHKGRKGGYGKTIIIRHTNGLKSLYAHLNSYNNKIRVGSYVKQGQFIGRVGTTGRSTGPHLHFGIYKNGRAIDPQKVISVTKTKLTGKKRKDFLKIVKKVKQELKNSKNKKPLKIENFSLSCKI
ncbi:MAG: endopeptidase [Arcobacter sp.]|nr:MAG: endopeptidase [Arcobacter sp.]